MSSTVSPASAGGSAKTNTPELAAQAKSLTIDVAAEGKEDHDFDWSVRKIAGECLVDRPLWLDHTRTRHDGRGLAPYSIRYVSNKEAILKAFEDEEVAIRKAIWRKVRELLGDDEVTPAIMIDQRTAADGSSRATLDLVFDSHKAVQAVADQLRHLHIQFSNGNADCLEFELNTNSLASDILVVECLRLPIDDVLNTEQLFEAFTDMASGVGTVLGLGEIIMKSKRQKILAPHGVVRCYVKIHEHNMGIPWSQLVNKLPSRFVWHGFPYTLRFQGSQLLKEDVYSSNYPASPAEEANQGTSAASSSKRPRTPNGESSLDSTTAKRSRSNEE